MNAKQEKRARYLTRRHERRVELTNARLALDDLHACSTPEELTRWRQAQERLIRAAQVVEHIRVGDTIRFSIEVLGDMTKPTYPLVRVVEIRLAADGSKVLVLQRADEQGAAD